MSAPSFAQLFRRSRYFRHEAGDIKQHRREVFMVAAIGFVLKHEPTFKRDFLKCLAEVEDGVSEFEPQIQRSHCTDLCLIGGNKCVVVVEFKANDDAKCLRRHQDPWEPDFWTRNGYGDQIASEFKGTCEVRYVVMQPEGEMRVPRQKEHLGIRFICYRRRWTELLQALENPRKLVADLFDSLGEIGIPELEDRKMRAIHATGHIEQAFGGWPIFDVLLNVAKALAINLAQKWPAGRFDVDENEEHKWVGIEWNSRAKVAEAFGSLSISGWFGYQRRLGESSEMAVWFYRNDAKKAEEVRQILISNGLVGAKLSEDGEAVSVTCGASESCGDLDWFRKILKLSRGDAPASLPSIGQ